MMNGRHLPAGQHDMNRRRSYNQQAYQPPNPMYNTYMNPYANYQQHPYQVPQPQYQHSGMPLNQYQPYPGYGRSPPPQYQQYPAPPAVVSSYPRPQHSPAVVSTPYQQPPPPQTPTKYPSNPVPSQRSAPSSSQIPATPTAPAPVPLPPKEPFTPPLPWFSHGSDSPWPIKKSRRKRKGAAIDEVELPNIQSIQGVPIPTETIEPSNQALPHPDTPSTTQAPSEDATSTTPTTPTSSRPTSNAALLPATPTANVSSRPATAVPVLPVVPKQLLRPASSAVVPEKKTSQEPTAASSVPMPTPHPELQPQVDEAKPEESITPAAPKLWANLFKGSLPSSTVAVNGINQDATTPATNGTFSKTNSESLSTALHQFSATTRSSKLAFLKPRGLINTGNMCYMNSVLQVLVFCIPFYDFLDQVGQRATHSFKSDTPLIDSMIMFMREYPKIDSAVSADQLRMRLKESELEQYGEAFTPEFVYDAIRRLPRFSTMQRGHQQDAEEFLGFLLEGLHDECVQVMRSTPSATTTPTKVPTSPTSEVASLVSSTTGEGANDWLEVGPKQRAAVTRASGISLESPIAKIFGGTLRSELRVPGMKVSVTTEPFQPLQLDIGSPDVNNVIDALKGLTRTETLHGDFKSPRGNVSAAKQVLIETLPPVLILHLKRFQYDNSGGTQKIWKRIGYPLELEIPKEVFARQKQSSMINHGGLPKYRLTGVVYHHGNNASGGHYTVDVRRQDGREWIRLDDTVIRRVRSEDVAEGGSEGDASTAAAALQSHKKDSPSSGNIFNQIKTDDDEAETEDEWKQVNGVSNSTANGTSKKWSSIATGTTTPKTKSSKFSVKDNKVAYILFYQKINL